MTFSHHLEFQLDVSFEHFPNVEIIFKVHISHGVVDVRTIDKSNVIAI